MPATLLPARIRRRPVKYHFPHSPLIRQWQLLDWLSLSSKGVTVGQAAREFGVSLKTIRRDLVLLEQLGFGLVETVEKFGRKAWRVRQPFERLRSKRRQYQAIAGLLDVVLSQAKRVGDAWLVTDLEAIRRRVARKCR